MKLKFYLLIITFVGFCLETLANPPYKIGDVVADFRLRGVDEKNVSLADYPAAKGFIIVFTSNHCPFSKAYEERIIALNNKFSPQGYQLIAINPNDSETYQEDSFANMQIRAKEAGFNFPYLTDPTQQVSKAFGASRTPQAFILKKEQNEYILHYMGAIDDNAQDASKVTKRYVEDAVNNLLAEKPIIITTTKAIGCAIRWKN